MLNNTRYFIVFETIERKSSFHYSVTILDIDLIKIWNNGYKG